MEITNAELARIFNILEVRPINSGGHIRGWVCKDGRPLIPLHYSHAKPLNGWAAEAFIKSLHLKKHEFERLRKGKMNLSEYLRIIEDRT